MNNEKFKKPNNIYEVIVLLSFIAIFSMRNVPIIMYATQLLFIIFSMLRCKNKKVKIIYFTSSLLFFMWCVASLAWSSDFASCIKFILEISQIFVFTSFLSFNLDDYDMIDKCLHFIGISFIILIIYTIFQTPLEEFKNIYLYNLDISSDEGRLGYTIGMHPNTLGYMCAVGCFLWLQFYKKYKKKNYLIICGLLIILLLFTKSRTSMLLLLAYLLVNYLFSTKSSTKKVLMVIVGVVLVGIVLNFIMTNEFMYNLIGFRFEGVLNLFNKKNAVDASITGRKQLINAGMEIVRQYPIFGVGAGNYAYVAYNKFHIWREVYSHSNLIELLSGLGIVGFLIYYIPKIVCICGLLNILKREHKNKNITCFFLTFIICELIFDYSCITYNNDAIQIINTLAFCYYLNERKEDYHESNC